MTHAHLDVVGGAGGDGDDPSLCGTDGGAGGEVSGDVAVHPGQVLSIWVAPGGHLSGAGAAASAGAPDGTPGNGLFGGGAGGAGVVGDDGGGGGGATAVYGSTSGSDGDLLVVAGGGGGGGGQGVVGLQCGGSGGDPGNPASAGHDGAHWLGAGGQGAPTNMDSLSHSGYAGNSSTTSLVVDGGGGGGGGGGFGYLAGDPAGVGAGGDWGGRDYSGTGGGGGGGGTSYAASPVVNPSFSTVGGHGSAGLVQITFGPATTTDLTVVTPTLEVGTDAALRAVVTGNTGGGSVAFTSDGTPIPGCETVGFSSGGDDTWQATCHTTALTAGVHRIVATYSGDDTYAGSHSTGQDEQVSGPSTVKLTLPTAPVAAGTPVTVSAAVTSTDPGNLSFSLDGSPVIACQSLATDAGTVSCDLGVQGTGPHTVSAQFYGDLVSDPTSTSGSYTMAAAVAPLVIRTPVALPDATVGQPYLAGFSASGGLAPYQWSHVSGVMPVTLSSTGLFTGTPDQAGSDSFQLEVDDASGQSVTRTFTLNVLPAPVVVPPVKPTPPVPPTAPKPPAPPAPADLVLGVGHTRFAHGSTGTYVLGVRNTGHSATVGTTTVRTTLPAGLRPRSAGGTGWACRISGQSLTCTRTAALAVGASTPLAWVRVGVEAARGQLVRSTWTVSPTDATPANNTVVSTLTVR